MRQMKIGGVLLCAAAAAAVVMTGCISVNRTTVVQPTAAWSTSGPSMGGMKRIGVTTTPVPQAVAAQTGVDMGSACMIASVSGGSPAEVAGLRTYDIITAIDGDGNARDGRLGQVIKGKNVGDTVTLTVLRLGKPMDIAVTIGEVAYR